LKLDWRPIPKFSLYRGRPKKENRGAEALERWEETPREGKRYRKGNKEKITLNLGGHNSSKTPSNNRKERESRRKKKVGRKKEAKENNSPTVGMRKD